MLVSVNLGYGAHLSNPAAKESTNQDVSSLSKAARQRLLQALSYS